MASEEEEFNEHFRSAAGADGWCELEYVQAVRYRDLLARWRDSGYVEVVARGRRVRCRVRLEDVRADELFGEVVHRMLGRAAAGAWSRVRFRGVEQQPECRYPPADWGFGAEMLGVRNFLSVVREAEGLQSPLVRPPASGFRVVVANLVPQHDVVSNMLRHALGSMLDPADASHRLVDRFVQDMPSLEAALYPGADVVYLVGHGHGSAGLGPSNRRDEAWLKPLDLAEALATSGGQVSFLRCCGGNGSTIGQIAETVSRRGVGLVVSFSGSPRAGASGDAMASFHSELLKMRGQGIGADFAVTAARRKHLLTGGEGGLVATMHAEFSGHLRL